MKQLLFAILTAFPTLLFAQERKYFTDRFDAISDKQTDNIRTYELGNDFTIISDTKKGSLIHKITIYGATNVDEVDKFAWYCIQGTSELYYKDYFRDLGALMEEYSGGEICKQILVKGNTLRYGQVWNSNREKILDHGDGHGSFLSDDGNETYYETYTDSVLVLRYGVRTVEKDTIHYTVDTMASPKGGLEEFYKEMVNVLRYPGVARLAGKEGRIYIEFIIDKDGRLSDFKPLTQEGYNLEKKAINKLEKLPSWNPATYKNHRVKQKFVLPILFRLR